MKTTSPRLLLTAALFVMALILGACGGKTTEAALPELPEDAESLVMLAKFDLSLKTGQDVENIITKSIEETVFEDSSLGVPQPGADIQAVATPGYIIILNAGGELYEYHASGAKVIQVPK